MINQMTSIGLNDLMKFEREIVNEFLKELLKNFSEKILAVYLFGSRAKNKARFDSDYDFLVLVEKKDIVLKNNIYDLAYDYLLKHQADISPKIVPINAWKEMKLLQTTFYINAIKDGILLWEKIK